MASIFEWFSVKSLELRNPASLIEVREKTPYPYSTLAEETPALHQGSTGPELNVDFTNVHESVVHIIYRVFCIQISNHFKSSK